MDFTGIIIQSVCLIFSLGIMYGSFNSRLKGIEKELTDIKDISERLARIEEQNKILLNFLKFQFN